MVGAQRAGPVAEIGLQPHQGPVAGLLQRLQRYPPPGGLHGSGQVTGGGLGLAQQVAQLHALALKLSPGLQQPVVVSAGQEVALVLGDRPGRVREDLLLAAACGQGGLPLEVKDAHVDSARRGVLPAQVPGGHQEGRLVTQDLTQLMQFTAQVGQRLRFGRVRPEQTGDTLPGLGRPGVQGQEADQGSRSRRSGPDSAGPIVSDGLFPEQRHLEHLNAAS